MNVAISPYVVFRRSRLPVNMLDALSFTSTWLSVDELRKLKEATQKQADILTIRLGEIIPTFHDSKRVDLLKLRRDIHNLRHERVDNQLLALEKSLDASVVSEILKWRDTALQAESCAEQVVKAFKDDTACALSSFPALFAHDSMSKGIQLSGNQLYRNLKHFVESHPEDIKPSKARVRESSLVNFAYRACFKPSPFGRFTEIGAFAPENPATAIWHAEGAPSNVRDEAPEDSDSSTTTLNRLLINWLLAAVPRLQGGLRAGYLVLNSTLQIGEEFIEFVGVLPGSHDEGRMASEQVLRLRRDPLINTLLEAMPTRFAPATSVLAAMSDASGSETSGNNVIQALIRAGVLFFRPNIDDHDPDYAMKLMDSLPANISPEMDLFRKEVSQLLLLETRFAEATVATRQELLKIAEKSIDNIAALAAVSPPSDSILRSPVFEDTPATTPPQSWALDTVQQSLESLTSLWKLASMLDNGQVKRLGLYSFATKLLDGRNTMPFLEFFGAYASLTDAEQLNVVLGAGVPAAEAYRSNRLEALKRIHSSFVYEDSTLYLEPELIKDAVNMVKDRVDTESVTFRTQFAYDALPNQEKTLVVNGLLTGYGVYFSRFGSFVKGSKNWTLSEAQRIHLNNRFPGTVDLNSVLGFNFNLHPPVTNSVLNYPGAVSLGNDRRVYNIADLEIRADPDSKTVRLWDPEAQEQLNLIPMNFLTPIGVPLLYRLLEAMTPSNRYLWKPLDDIMDSTGYTPDPSGITKPRLVVGNVVAERQAWTLPSESIPQLKELSRNDLGALIDFDSWRLERGLPQHAFVLCQTKDERDIMAGRGRKATRDWADFAHMRRASVHKPMYVDFRNPYLVRSFAKSALSRPGIIVEVRECLPSPDSYSQSDGRTATEEFFVELHTK